MLIYNERDVIWQQKASQMYYLSFVGQYFFRMCYTLILHEEIKKKTQVYNPENQKKKDSSVSIKITISWITNQQSDLSIRKKICGFSKYL